MSPFSLKEKVCTEASPLEQAPYNGFVSHAVSKKWTEKASFLLG